METCIAANEPGSLMMGLACSRNASSVAKQEVALYIPPGAAYLAFVSALVISLLGVLGNVSTILALVKYSRGSAHASLEATTKFVIFLAATDLSFCLLVLPITAVRYLYRSWPLGKLLCCAYPFVFYGTVASSLMLITVITMNRLVLISLNVHYRRLYTPVKVHVQAASCFIFSFGIMCVPLLGVWGRLGYQPSTFSCTILRDDRGRSPKKFLFTLGFILPMCVIVVCYSLILVHVRRQSATVSTGTKTSRRDMRLTMLICVVFFGFLACFLPLFIGNVFVADDRLPYFHVMASIAAWLNACINPFIYFALNPRYRSAFRQLFHRPVTRYNVRAELSEGGGRRAELSLTSDRVQVHPIAASSCAS